MSELISRQAAIDVTDSEKVSTNPSHFEAHQKFTQFMDDAEISSFGRWQWSNGFNTALTAVGIDLKKLPSAQPEPHEGHWILYDKRFPWRTWYKCSECGNYLDFSGVNGGRGEVNFCPNCGADMRGKQNEL